jgi:two-component system sensor histidine kinase MprB
VSRVQPARFGAEEGVEPTRWHYRRSLASRVTLLTTIAVGLSVAFVALGAYVTTRVQLGNTLDSSLLERAQRAATQTTLANSVRAQIPPWALGAGDIRIAFVDLDQQPQVISDAADPNEAQIELGEDELAVALRQEPYSLRTVAAGGERFRVVAVPAGQDRQALVLAQSLAPQEKVLGKLGFVTVLFGLAGMVAAGMAGWGVATNGLRPVRRLTGAVETIARTERLEPIPVEGDDEVARLATSFNQMLLALDLSRARQRQLVADAGHELRTPLTSLRTNIELLGQADADGADGGGQHLPPEARAELLSDVAAQIEELSQLVGDLVELARDEPLPTVVEAVELVEVVDHAVERVRRRAPSVTFRTDLSPWVVSGEAGTLERAVTNLLDNAAKWSPPGGTVRVRLAGGVLSVEDEGPGIAEHDLPHVFDRFYRSEESRAMPGSGLGLSIVAQAAARHAGSVRAERSPHGGARLVLHLPGSPAPQGAAAGRA